MTRTRVVSDALLEQAGRATPDAPFRIACSACLMGHAVLFDGTALSHALLAHIAGLDNVRVLPFCPEDFGLGTPRPWMAIHGGTGADVLDGRARIIDKTGTDVTQGFLDGGAEMARRAREHRADLAVLTETSPSCSVHVLHRGERWPETEYRQGMGTTATFLHRAGIPVLSSRDRYSLGLLAARLDPAFRPDPDAIDTPDGDWYREYFR